MAEPCQIGENVAVPDACTSPPGLSRRSFAQRAALGLAGLTCTDFLDYFLRHGMPHGGRSAVMAAERAREVSRPKFLIYWFLEGGWMGYDMFNPVLTDNNLLSRLENISDERYRVLRYGEDGFRIRKHGNIRYGFLCEPGKPLFGDMAVLSSMHSGTFHSGQRLITHMGSYNFRHTEERQEDERSVMQAFAEVCGQPYVLPNVSWHWWLSDGELNEAQYTGRRGYYHALGPVHAHTIYAGTPAKLKSMLMRMRARADRAGAAQVERFLDATHKNVLTDEYGEAVKSYNSARQIYQQLSVRGRSLDRATISQLFTDPELRSRFGVTAADELITYRSVNGNKARSKFAPKVNVQAMMTYELMRAGLSCGFWIESRDIRRFDSHRARSGLWRGKEKTPVGQTDQTGMCNEDLWQPLLALVELLKSTQYQDTGTSLFDHTTIVLTSEFGRTIHGDVKGITEMKISDKEKREKIGGQDICQHWKVTSAAFLGGRVRGDTQFGRIGEHTLLAIPLMPDGSLDPAYDPRTGELIDGRTQSDKSRIPNHGSVYATALHLCDINPKGRGRNDRPPLEFIRKA